MSTFYGHNVIRADQEHAVTYEIDPQPVDNPVDNDGAVDGASEA